jgi:hypothetical protein
VARACGPGAGCGAAPALFVCSQYRSAEPILPQPEGMPPLPVPLSDAGLADAGLVDAGLADAVCGGLALPFGFSPNRSPSSPSMPCAWILKCRSGIKKLDCHLSGPPYRSTSISAFIRAAVLIKSIGIITGGWYSHVYTATENTGTPALCEEKLS